MKNEKTLHMIAFLVLVLAGLNWGAYGLLGVNFVTVLFGGFPALAMVIYLLAGLSAIYLTIFHFGDCRTCSGRK
jgi:uncharacterized membrane protein YuzA (DUF378 family)